MPRKLLQRHLPHPDTLRDHRSLKWLGDHLHDPSLWHLSRRSVARAVAIGLFVMYLPIPFQMAVAAFLAISFRANLPLSVALVWLTNPVTIPAMFYLSYRVGALLLGWEHDLSEDLLTVGGMFREFGQIWPPLFVGGVVVGLFLAAVGYGITLELWRLSVLRQRTHRSR